MMPILSPEKPKRITFTVANTLFGALSGVRPVNWGLIIHDIIEQSLPLIGQEPSYISPLSCTSTRATDAPQLTRTTC